jgi:hypothetical protein
MQRHAPSGHAVKEDLWPSGITDSGWRGAVLRSMLTHRR